MSASLNWIAWSSAIALAERPPLLRVRARDVVGGLGDPERLGGDPDPAAVERRHRDREALALLVQKPVAGRPGALDHEIDGRRRVEAELLLLARHPHVLGVEEERRDAARSLDLGLAAGEDEERAGVAAVRDPLLRARDRPAVAVRVGARSERAGVGAGPRLGEREGADRLAARERRHEALALLVGAEGEDRQRAGARVHGDRDADARVRARELLEHEDVGEEVGPRAAELGRHADAHQPELGRAWRRALSGSGARGPTRPRSARSRPARPRARAPGSPAGPRSGRSPSAESTRRRNCPVRKPLRGADSGRTRSAARNSGGSRAARARGLRTPRRPSGRTASLSARRSRGGSRASCGRPGTGDGS